MNSRLYTRIRVRGITEPAAEYAHRFAVAQEQFSWQARMGAAGHPYDVHKQIIDGRAPFVSALACSHGPQAWRSQRVDTASSNPVAFLLTPLAGPVRVGHVGTEVELTPGRFTVCLSNEPITTAHPERSRIVLAFLTGNDLVQDNRLTAMAGKDHRVQGAAALLLRHLTTTLAVADGLDDPTLAAAGNAASELLTTTLLAGPSRPDAHETALADRIRTFVELHLADHGLGVAQIAVEHHVSVRTAQRAFEGSGQSLAAYIRCRRMIRCRTDIQQRPDLSLAAISSRWGVADPKHFARQYRAQFGESPRTTRYRAALDVT